MVLSTPLLVPPILSMYLIALEVWSTHLNRVSRLSQPLYAGLSTTLLTAESSNREFLAHAVFIDDSSDADDDPCKSWKQVCGL